MTDENKDAGDGAGKVARAADRMGAAALAGSSPDFIHQLMSVVRKLLDMKGTVRFFTVPFAFLLLLILISFERGVTAMLTSIPVIDKITAFILAKNQSQTDHEQILIAAQKDLNAKQMEVLQGMLASMQAINAKLDAAERQRRAEKARAEQARRSEKP